MLKWHHLALVTFLLLKNCSTFNKALAEKCIEGQNNNCIVFGRDRPGHEGSGYGGLGDTDAGSIDIVVGRNGNPGEFVNPDFVNDAQELISHRRQM